jgi:ATP-dependent DNA ligase
MNSLQVRQEDQDSLESQGRRVQLARMDFQERREALEQLVLQDLQDFQELEDLQAFLEAQEHLV